MLAIFSILESVLNFVTSANEVLSSFMGLPLVDVLVVIVAVSFVSVVLKPRTDPSKHTIYLSLVCVGLSVLWSVLFLDSAGFKASLSLGFRLAAVSTLTYNVVKPIFKPAVKKMYSWLRGKGVEVEDV